MPARCRLGCQLGASSGKDLPTTCPCRWRCGRRSPTATSCSSRPGTAAGCCSTSGERISTLIWGRLDARPRLRRRRRRPAGSPSRCRRPAGSPTRSPASCANGSRSTRPPTPRPPGSSSCGPSSSGCATRWRSSPRQPAARRRDVGRPGRPPQRRHRTAQRGADVGGLLGPLEIDATMFERDLIVGNAQRRDARDRAVAPASCAPTWSPARPLSSSWPPSAWRPSTRRRTTPSPTSTRSARCRTPRAIDAYRSRLERVGEALNLAAATYADALAEHTRPGRPARRLVAKAPALGLADEPDLAGARRRPARCCPAAGPVRWRRPWSTPTRPGSPGRGHHDPLALHRGRDPPMKCTQPGCTGTIVDGYCDVCGMAPAEGAGATAASPASDRRRRAGCPDAAGSPTAPPARQPGCAGTIVDGYCDVCGTAGRRSRGRRRRARPQPVSQGAALGRPPRPAGCSPPPSAPRAGSTGTGSPPAVPAPGPSGCARPGSAPA